jgi:broad specificity polyphosphatase/5'/3'-nucleotidase SurE
MSSHEQTLKLVTNLDRAAIESRIAGIRAAAQSAGLAEAAQALGVAVGAPREALEAAVRAALKALADRPEHKALAAQLELVEINLPNLK